MDELLRHAKLLNFFLIQSLNLMSEIDFQGIGIHVCIGPTAAMFSSQSKQVFTVTTRYSAYVLLFPVRVGFAAGVYVYLPWPSCRPAKAQRQVTDTSNWKE